MPAASKPGNTAHGAGFVIGEWTVLPFQNLLRKATVERRIQPLPMAALVMLHEQAPDTVTRQQLLHALWNDRPGADESLTRCIADLRAALEDSPGTPTFIQTVPRRGYRLLQSGTPQPSWFRWRVRPATLLQVLALGALVMGLLVALQWQEGSTPPPSTNRILVMPLGHQQEAQAMEAADLVLSEVVLALSRSAHAQVVSETTARSLAGRSVPVGTLHQELGIDFLVEGTINRIADNRFAIQVQVIDCRQDEVIHSETLFVSGDALYQASTRLARSLAHELQISLQSGLDQLQALSPADQRMLMRLRRDAFEELAFPLAQQASLLAMLDEKYPRTPEILAQLAFVQALLGYQSNDINDFVKAERVADATLQLDAGNPMALLVKAIVNESTDGNRALELYEQLLALVPNARFPNLSYGLYLSALGYHHEARRYIMRAYHSDPLSESGLQPALYILTLLGEQQAIEQLLDLEMRPLRQRDKWEQSAMQLFALLREENVEAAATFLARYSGQAAGVAEWQAVVQAMLYGDTDTRRAMAARVLAWWENPASGPDPYYPVAVLTLLGEPGLALQATLARDKSIYLAFVLNLVWFDEMKPLREEARFAELLRKLGVLDVWETRGMPERCSWQQERLSCD